MFTYHAKYEDFNENMREEDFLFNLTEAEISEMEMSVDGGLDKMIDRIMKAQDMPSLIKLFKEIIAKAYGVKSDDGRKFMKSPEILADFVSTNAYSQLFMELATNDVTAANFLNGIVPKEKRELIKEISEQHK